MDATTAALFPSEFEDSELGPLPRGWSSRSLYGTGEFINGAAYKAFRPNLEQRGLPIIKIAELKAGITSQTAYSDVEMPEKYRLESGDILFSWSGNPDTSIDTFVWSHGSALLNQHIFKVVPGADRERTLVLAMLKHLRPTFAEIARNKQTTGLGHITVADLKELRVTSPPSAIIEAWAQIADPIHSRMLCNQYQIRLLDNLREALLPRLISGKLRLPDAESIIKEATA
jgi:type I restriction enzyme S subunit